jgi:hypothetical protein
MQNVNGDFQIRQISITVLIHQLAIWRMESFRHSQDNLFLAKLAVWLLGVVNEGRHTIQV